MPTISPYVPANSEFLLDFFIDGRQQDLAELFKKAELRFDLNEIPRATFHFKTDQKKTAEQKQLMFRTFSKKPDGTPLSLEVHITTDGKTQTLFKGIVKSVETRIENEDVLLTVECLENGYALLKNFAGSASGNLAFDHYLQTNLAEAGLDFTSDERYSFLTETLTKSPATLPWTFLVNYLNLVGIMPAVRNGQFSLIDLLQPIPEKYVAEGGTNVFSFKAKRTGNKAKSLVTLETWDSDNQEIKKITSEQNVQKNEEVIKTTQPFSDPTFQRIADAMIASSNLTVIQGKITTYGNLEAKAGDYIGFGNLNDEVNEQTFLITSESHILKNNLWKTTYCFGVKEEDQMRNKVAPEIPFVSSVTHNNDSFGNLHIGIVTAIENDPKSQYRIKVSIPLLEEGDGIWARLSTLNAGKKTGSFFLPNINDEVIVGYLGNDLNSPVILGSLFSSNKPMPFEPAVENELKGFITAEGTQILLNDKDKSIELRTTKGNKLIMGDQLGFLFQDENNNRIIMNKQGITLETDKDFKVSAKGEIRLEGEKTKFEAVAVMELKASIIKIN